MAGKIRHMERSRRSHNKYGNSTFRSYGNTALTNQRQKKDKTSFAEILKKLLHKNQDK